MSKTIYARENDISHIGDSFMDTSVLPYRTEPQGEYASPVLVGGKGTIAVYVNSRDLALAIEDAKNEGSSVFAFSLWQDAHFDTPIAVPKEA